MTTASEPLLAGELLWSPPADVLQRTAMGRYWSWLEETGRGRFATWERLWRWSVDDLEAFWASIWDYFQVAADGPAQPVLATREMPGAKWFPDARLNFAEHALRHSDREETVLFARSQTRDDIRMTRGELRLEVGRVQDGLRSLGVGPGDRVAAYLPNVPEAVIAFLATAAIGATWLACPPEFGIQGAVDRLSQADPDVLIAVDGYRWGEKEIDRRSEVAELRALLPSLRATIEVPYLRGPDADPPAGSLTWSALGDGPREPDFVRVAFDHPLWIVFSSGTTGLPKPIVHGHGGAVLEQCKALALHHDLGPGDRFFFFSTTGWMVWNQVVASLLTGAGAVLADGDPLYPDADALWRLAADSGVTHFGASAAFMMASRKAGLNPPARYDLSRVRFLKSAGSPLSPDGYRWLAAQFPGVFFSSSSGGTDVCTGFVGGVPVLPVRAGEMASRWLGVHAESWDQDGHPLVDQTGQLVILAPMPSMPVGFLNDADGERYRTAYFDTYPGVWCHGDWFVLSARGTCAILGRSDATLNRGGVRLGTSEFYSVVDAFDEIDDSLVVHLEDGGGLGTLVLFVRVASAATLDEELRGRITRALRTAISPRHSPDLILAVPGIPRGVTGKRLEVPVKRVLLGADQTSVIAGEDASGPAAEAIAQIVLALRSSLAATQA
jgi:acetoacetyl-CoA synthetase